MATTKAKLSQSQKSLLQKQKRALRKEQNEMRHGIGRALRAEVFSQEHEDAQAEKTQIQRRNAFHHGVTRLVKLVAGSYGLAPGIKVDLRESHFGDMFTSAHTDFKNIHVTLPMLQAGEDGEYDPDELREWVLTLTGLSYHEMGHMVFSVPFAHLPFTALGVDGRLLSRYHRCWNLLEDQRMETALVGDSPIMAKYLTATFLRFTKKNMDPTVYMHAAGRWYLPKEIRDALRRRFFQAFGETLTKKVDSLTRRYNLTTDAIELAQIVMEWRDLEEEVQPEAEVTNHREGDYLDDLSPEEIEELLDRSKDLMGDPPEDEDLVDDEGEGEDLVPEEADDGAEEATNPAPSTPPQPGAPVDDDDDSDAGDFPPVDLEDDFPEDEDENEPTPPAPVDKDQGDDLDIPDAAEDPDADADAEDIVDKMLEDIESDDLFQDHLDQNVADMLDAITDEYLTALPKCANETPMSERELEEANALAAGIQRALECAIAPAAPKWESRTRQGVLDAFQYRTRRRGDRSFYRQRVGEGEDHFDIAVSLILDRSGSMTSAQSELSVMAHGVKSACDAVGVPCTITVYGSKSELFLDADEPASGNRIPIEGATNPVEALKTVPDQDHGKSNHLVIMMTDGEWTERVPPVVGLGDPHRINMGFVFQSYGDRRAHEEAFGRISFNDVHHINNLNDIAITVENTIIQKVKM